jgi:hypothetical protein
MIKLVHKACSIELDRGQALKLELKLNLTKKHEQNYVAIGDDLYRFQSGPDQTTITRSVTEDEYNYLSQLNDVDYDKVMNNPKSYEKF